MREVGVLEARTHFSKLIEQIEATGEEIVITRHGKPVVRLMRVRPSSRGLSGSDLVMRMKALHAAQSDGAPISWKELKEEIRR